MVVRAPFFRVKSQIIRLEIFSRCAFAPLREKLLFDSVNANRFEKHFSRGGATAQRNSF
jgi:hypothetical protein